MTARQRFIACLPFALTLSYLAAQGITTHWPTLLLACVACAYVVIATGEIAFRVAGVSDLPPAAAWTCGTTVIGPVLYACQLLIPIKAITAFVICAVVVVLITAMLLRRSPSAPPLQRIDFVGLVLCCLFTTAWCRTTAEAPVTLANVGQLPAWIDYYLHAGVLSSFGDPLAIGRGIVWLSDIAWFPYHYASYPLAAAFAVPLDQPGLALSTSIWLPIGFLTLATGAYTLGKDIARGASGGIAALIAVLVLPDASNYWLRNGFFSFHWNVLTHPGAAYALGSAFLSIVLLRRWTETRSRPTLVASALLVGATLLFRMHLGLLLFPAWVIVLCLASDRFQRRRPIVLAVVGALLIAVAVVLRLAPDVSAGGFLSFREGRALDRAMMVIHRRQEPTAYQGLYLQLQNQFGDSFALVAGALLILPALLGLFLVLLPLAIWLERARTSMRGVDAFPFALFVPFMLLLLFAPIPTHDDPTDLIHRPTVLLYSVVAIWTLSLLVRWLSAQGAHPEGRMWQTLVLCATTGLLFVWAHADELARPKFHWARAFNDYPVSAELRAAATVLRAHARPGDTFATTVPPMGRSAVDVPTVIVAMSGMPSYLARVWIQRAAGGVAAKIAGQRYSTLTAVERLKSPDEAMRTLREVGIRWYVATTPDGPLWDPTHRRAMWVRGSVAIYDLSATTSTP